MLEIQIIFPSNRNKKKENRKEKEPKRKETKEKRKRKREKKGNRLIGSLATSHSADWSSIRPIKKKEEGKENNERHVSKKKNTKEQNSMFFFKSLFSMTMENEYLFILVKK